MNDLILRSETTPHGLRTILIENRLVRLVVLPEVGARIWQITYKPLDANLLWNKPGVAPARQALHACYDDTWSGGWDDLFPNDEAGTLLGNALPDHGELWTGEWQAEPFQRDDSVGVHLRFTTPISSFLAEKTLTLRPESAVHRSPVPAYQPGRQRVSIPVEAASGLCRLTQSSHRFPAPWTVLLEPDFPGTLAGAPPSFPWPFAPLGDAVLDLRQVPDISSRAVHFFYGTGLAAGWCGVTNRATRLAAALRFDPEVFSELLALRHPRRLARSERRGPGTGYRLPVPDSVNDRRRTGAQAGSRREPGDDGAVLGAGRTHVHRRRRGRRAHLAGRRNLASWRTLPPAQASAFGAASSDRRIAAAIAVTAPADCIQVSRSPSSSTASTTVSSG